MFELHDRVIVGRCKRYDNKYFGCHGEIICGYNNFSFGVKLDGIDNPKSKKNLYYFTSSSLSFEYASQLPYTVAVIAFTDKFKLTVPTDAYMFRYKCYDDTITKGDFVVVQSAHNGINIGKVFSITSGTVTEDREIISKFNPAAYIRRKNNNRDNSLTATIHIDNEEFVKLIKKYPDLMQLLNKLSKVIGTVELS